MTLKSATMLPITPDTVTVNGSGYGARDLIWAGFRWTEAECRDSAMTADHFLSVPWCHPDNDVPSADCGWYRVRPWDENYRFERATNGQFVLRIAP